MLNINQLVKVYPGPVAALQGIDIEIGNGLFGLLGPNGAGKSTLMKVVAGILEPTAGEVLLDGVDITVKPEYMWERLGYLPQEFGFYPNLTGRSMLAYLLRLKGVHAPNGEKRLCDDLLGRVNLGHAANRKVGGYSGGMLQRLGIAQAIAGDPQVIIVDEPTAGLDPEERLRFYHILAELAASRIVILSTHIVEDVSVLCPQFAIIDQGRFLAKTTPEMARAAVAGKIYQGDVDPAQLELFQQEYCVIHCLLFEGRNRVRIYLPNRLQPEGFTCVAATLEDAYFTTIRTGGLPVLGQSSCMEKGP